MRFARTQILGVVQIANAREAELLAEPGDADADDGEDDRFEQRGLGEMAAAHKQDAERDAQRRGRSPGPKPPNPAANKTAGMKMRKEPRFPSQGCSPQANMSQTPTTAAAAQ